MEQSLKRLLRPIKIRMKFKFGSAMLLRFVNSAKGLITKSRSKQQGKFQFISKMKLWKNLKVSKKRKFCFNFSPSIFPESRS